MSKPNRSYKSEYADTIVEYCIEDTGVYFIFGQGGRIFGMLNYEKTDWRTKSIKEVEEAIEEAIKGELYSFF